MPKDMKTRKGKDGFHYPYTSPDLVIDENGKSNTKKFEEISSQFKDIANLSLIKHTDGKVYIKKQDGTLLGDGIEVGNDTDLSKITMSMSGQTLKLMNDGTQIATVEIPTVTISDSQVNNAVNSYLQNNPITLDDLWSDVVEGDIYEVKAPPKQTGITVQFIQGSTTIYVDNTLDSLKSMLIVNKVYDDDSVETTNDYTLSGTLTVGTSVITVTSGSYTKTFNVIVSEKPQATLTGITATYSQGDKIIYPSASLDDLKSDLVVTATYSDSSTATVSDYVLSGTLTIGTSTITVTYQEKTATFTITVTKESGYVTNGLKTYYDFTQYEDGYLTELNDLSGNSTPYTLYYNNENKSNNTIGFKNGVFQSGRRTVGAYNCDCTFIVDDSNVIGQYPLTIEGYLNASAPKANISEMFNTRYEFDATQTSKLNYYSHKQCTGILTGVNVNNGISMSGSASILSATSDDNIWNTEVFNHIVISLNTSEHKVYLNGNLVLSDNTNAPTLAKGINTLLITGNLKLLRIYNTILSENEISRNYNDVLDTIGGNN